MATVTTPQAAITAYQEAYQKLSEAEVAQEGAQHAYEAALNGKQTADGNAADAVAAYNASIEAAIAALAAAKRTPAPVVKAA